MSPSPQKLREICLLALYADSCHSATCQLLCDLLMRELRIGRQTVAKGIERARQIQNYLPELDRRIADTAKGFAPERIGMVERSALRLGIFELLIESQIPKKVAISEAVRLVCKFGSRESSSFVNAILDALNATAPQEAP